MDKVKDLKEAAAKAKKERARKEKKRHQKKHKIQMKKHFITASLLAILAFSGCAGRYGSASADFTESGVSIPYLFTRRKTKWNAGSQQLK